MQQVIKVFNIGVSLIQCACAQIGVFVQCSSTCEGGFQRRVVVCQDADGRGTNHCDERVKPDESKSCDSGPCPHWNYGIWGEVRLMMMMMSSN